MGSMFKPEYVFQQNKAGQNNKPWTAMKHEDLFIYGKAQSKKSQTNQPNFLGHNSDSKIFRDHFFI